MGKQLPYMLGNLPMTSFLGLDGQHTQCMGICEPIPLH
jgi:hypothetical protein